MPRSGSPRSARRTSERIGQALCEHLSPRHVPDRILAAPGGPRTLTGKKLEIPVERLLLGATAPVWQVGEVLIAPAVVYVAFTASGWRRTLSHVVVVCVAFALPIVAYESAADAVGGHFRLANGGITTFYGRVAAAADCATLRLPADERPLCPSRQLVAQLGIDGLGQQRQQFVAAP